MTGAAQWVPMRPSKQPQGDAGGVNLPAIRPVSGRLGGLNCPETPSSERPAGLCGTISERLYRRSGSLS